MEEPLISIIMPAYNAARTIGEAIRSVQQQSWTHWELIVVDDGSTDRTAEVVEAVHDARIHLQRQPNAGVSAARNRGLDVARGVFVAFLDADDSYPPNSLRARAERLMARPEAAFADGAVMALDDRSGALSPRHSPTFQGDPFPLLMAMDRRVFFGPSWMIRRTAIGETRLPMGMTHAEDLAFCLSLARRGIYVATPEVVLHYRTGHASAMSDLKGLHRGYRQLYLHAAYLAPPPEAAALQALWERIRTVMWRSYLKAARPWDALRVLFERPPAHPGSP